MSGTRVASSLSPGRRSEMASAGPPAGWIGSAAWAEKADRWSCCKCGGALQDPVLLSCLHSMCKRCLAEHGRIGSITCARCQSSTPVPTATQLIQDYLAMDYLCLTALQSDQSHVPFCGECEDEEQATCRCMECLQFLCSLHQTAHRKSKSTKSHKLVGVGDLQSVTASSAVTSTGNHEGATAAAGSGPSLHLAAGRVQMVCSSHGMKDVELFCQTCSCCLCRDCIVVGHKNHDYMFIKDAMKKQDLIRGVEQAEAWEKQLEGTLVQVKEADDGLAGNFHKASDTIAKAGEMLKKLIDQRCEQLKKDVDKIYQRKSTLLDGQKSKLQQLSDDLSFSAGFCRFTLEEGSSTQSMSLKATMKSRLRTLSQLASSQALVPNVDSSVIVHIDPQPFEDAVADLGFVTSSAVPSMCIIEAPVSAYVGSNVVANINFFDAAGEVVAPTENLQISVIGPGSQLDVPLKACELLARTSYQFQPSEPGFHVIHAAAGGVPLPETSLIVERPPWCWSESLRCIPGQLRNIDGFRIAKSGLAVSVNQDTHQLSSAADDGSLHSHYQRSREGVFMQKHQQPCQMVIFNGSVLLKPSDIEIWNITFELDSSDDNAVDMGNFAVGVAFAPVEGVDLLTLSAEQLLQCSSFLFGSGKVMHKQQHLHQHGKLHKQQNLLQHRQRAQHPGAAMSFSPGEKLTLQYSPEHGVVNVSKAADESYNLPLPRRALPLPTQAPGSRQCAILPLVLISEDPSCRGCVKLSF